MHLRLNRSGRTWPLLLGLLVIGAIFIVRLFWLQIIQHDYYEQQANAEHISKFTLLANRGVIYARDGEQLAPLVLNQPVYLVYADPAEVENKQAIIDAVRQVAGGNAVKNFEKGLDDQALRYTVLAKGLSKTQAELLQKKKLAGVGFQQSEQRVYPEGTMAAQLLGFVDSEGKGQYGVEGALDDRLKGKNGELKAVTDVRQIPLTVSGDYVNQPAQNGDDLVLNID